jgi:hypothetical protein
MKWRRRILPEKNRRGRNPKADSSRVKIFKPPLIYLGADIVSVAVVFLAFFFLAFLALVDVSVLVF